MRVGDIVKVYDGSYNMSLIGGNLSHAENLVQQKRLFRVKSLSGEYPTYRSPLGYRGDNSILLVDVNDPDFVLFSQERFCRVNPSSARPSPVTVHVPRGTKEVHLVL